MFIPLAQACVNLTTWLATTIHFPLVPLSMKSPFMTLKRFFTLVTITMYKLNQDWQMFCTHTTVVKMTRNSKALIQHRIQKR